MRPVNTILFVVDEYCIPHCTDAPLCHSFLESVRITFIIFSELCKCCTFAASVTGTWVDRRVEIDFDSKNIIILEIFVRLHYEGTILQPELRTHKILSTCLHASLDKS